MDKQAVQKISARWEAGEIGCGQLIVGLQKALAALQPGENLELTTHDGGAPVDIPAWCRMTGHELLASNHPIYVIRKKGDQHV